MIHSAALIYTQHNDQYGDLLAYVLGMKIQAPGIEWNDAQQQSQHRYLYIMNHSITVM